MAGEVVGMMAPVSREGRHQVAVDLARALTTLRVGIELVAAQDAPPSAESQHLLATLIAAAEQTIATIDALMWPSSQQA